MGKYIIEVGDAHVRHALGRKLIIPVIINNNTEYWVNTNIQLTPYTEPDTDEAYQRGLNDAWEAARKIANIPYGEEEKAFGSSGWAFIEKHTASEAIEKIRQYEKEQGEIQVGDEVTDDKGDTGVCTEISYPANSMHIMYADGTATDISLTGITQTGRHFPEIAAILEKMNEGS